VLFYTTLGLGVLQNAFEEAAMLYTHTNGYFGKKNIGLAKRAYAFIQGTGLEMCIQMYDLSYDADELRQTFFRIFHVKNQS